ncbi:hypothetical protein D1222_06020 [Henriciella algicola]|uniref:Uncharacterized protein n=1 Tax=Henriciella algicola TaxID=1608422 RepID=A0A399RP87_9PROT|nr:hypothetical protein D1222_06020 [Henriciella algicola]
MLPEALQGLIQLGRVGGHALRIAVPTRYADGKIVSGRKLTMIVRLYGAYCFGFFGVVVRLL